MLSGTWAHVHKQAQFLNIAMSFKKITMLQSPFSPIKLFPGWNQYRYPRPNELLTRSMGHGKRVQLSADSAIAEAEKDLR